MDKMRVYHLTEIYLGHSAVLKPNIPECAVKAFEDTTIPRICVATSIMGCIRALELPYSNLAVNYKNGEKLNIHCYVSDVPVYALYQPTINEVKDVYKTGELWILHPYRFELLRTFTLKQLEEPTHDYSRFQLCDPIFSSEDGCYTTNFIAYNKGPDVLEY